MVLKQKYNPETDEWDERRSFASGKDSDAFEKQVIYKYKDNADGDPFKVNDGYEVIPLSKEIFCEESARMSKINA